MSLESERKGKEKSSRTDGQRTGIRGSLRGPRGPKNHDSLTSLISLSSQKYTSNGNLKGTTFHMSKLSGSLVIDLSHDEANTISSSASKIDGLFVCVQLELDIRHGSQNENHCFHI